MLSETLATARTEYYQAIDRLAGAQQLYDELLTQQVLSEDAFTRANAVLAQLKQEKKIAYGIYMREVGENTEAMLQRAAEAQQGTFQVSMLISPPAEYAQA